MIKIVVNSSKSKIFNCPKSVEYKIRKACSYQQPNYQYSDAYILGRWDGYIRKYSLQTHSFPSGLIYRVSKVLKKEGLDFEVEDRRKTFEWSEEKV